ncbi:hypothetical protein CLHUN_34630 [Ruminiclostridium hungatei]|uniref:HTH cro/C1-type domain-containing protein n=1 Tax=Ruminiclostridium hungatei TaxID=48256 RepID=A0A1V4SHC4_RUMHU|nr:hypothetical protein CLHUN_34630 [Ruminiclostridium hungatei]
MFGENLKNLRKQKGFSQEKLAERLHMVTSPKINFNLIVQINFQYRKQCTDNLRYHFVSILLIVYGLLFLALGINFHSFG